jgi:hypothetical protein
MKSTNNTVFFTLFLQIVKELFPKRYDLFISIKRIIYANKLSIST